MAPSSKPENAIRRLFRESEARRHSTTARNGSVDENVSTTIDRLELASAEMDRLRAVAISQQDLIWDQKRDLAEAQRQVADALDQATRSDRLLTAEKVRAELAVTRAERLEREVAALRAHVGRLTNAVSQSFERDDKITALRIVA